MSSIAVLFPGQGAQHVGMCRDIFERSAAGRAVFEKADDALGFALSEMIFAGGEDDLTRTDIAQPAILTASIAVAEAAREAGWQPHAGAAAGLSLGEYSALVFAGAIPFEEAVLLVRKRGEFMREAGRRNPGGMLGVIGLADDIVAQIVETARAEGALYIANLNCPGQVVLSGEDKPLQAAAEIATQKGALKTLFLNVEGAFHSPLMEPAAARLAAELDSAPFVEAHTGVVANRTASIVTRPDQIRRRLFEQLTSPVLWDKSIRRLLADGVGTFVELGPGRTLAGMVKRIDRKVKTLSVCDFDGALSLAGRPAP